MITDYFPVIDPITSSEAQKGSSQRWDRHTAFGVLASTCLHLRRLFYHRSWGTKLVTAERLPALIKPPKEVTCQLPVHLIEYVPLPTRTTRPRSSRTLITNSSRRTLIVPLTDGRAELLRQCLMALPSLRALGIADDGPIVTATIRTVFRNKPDFPNIKKVTVPVCAHPMLARFPGITELVCYHCPTKQTIIKSVLSSTRVSYVKLENGETESVLKSVSVMGPIGDGLTKRMDPPHHRSSGLRTDPMHSYSPCRKILEDSQGLSASGKFPSSLSPSPVNGSPPFSPRKQI